MKKNQVLIIVSGMAPRVPTFGECQRMAYLGEYLLKNGYSVTAVAPGRKINRRLGRPGFDTVFLGGDLTPGLPLQTGTPGCGLLKSLDGFLYNEPSDFYGGPATSWCRRNKDKIIEIIEKREVSKVIISAPYFSLFGLGPYIKKRCPGVKLVFDYRDPWSLWNGNKGAAFYKEKNCLKSADRVVCFSRAFARDMRGRVYRGGRYEVVYNGFLESLWTEVEGGYGEEQGASGFVVSFIGNISVTNDQSGYRNPNRLIRAFQRFSKGREDVELRFVGVSRRNALMKQIESGSRHKIKFQEQVPAGESFRCMLESDVLVSIHEGHDDSGRYLVSGKLYDYMRSGRTVLNIGDCRSLMAGMVDRYGLGANAANEEGAIEAALEGMYQRWGQRGRERRKLTKKVLEYSRESQNERYKGILDQL